MTAWTKAEAQAHDARLAELSEAAYAIQERVERLAEQAYSAAGARLIFYGNGKARSLDGRRPAYWDDVKAAGRGELELGKWGDLERLRGALAEHEQAAHELAIARHDVRAFDEAGYRGWPRFFLVPDGHIHSSTHCSSLRITTRIGWLPDLSGETEESAVAAHGAMLCTKCFPSAPVEWTRGRPEDPSKCTGQPAPGSDYRRRYQTCSECGYVGAITSRGALRKHKRAEATK